MPYTAAANATIRQACPATSTSGVGLVGRELRGALRHQRAGLTLVDRPLLDHVDDDLAIGAERIREVAPVGDGDRCVAVAVTDAEVRRVTLLLVPRDDLPDQLVLLAGSGRGGGEVGRLAGLGGGREARVRERAGEQHGGTERDNEADRALTGRVHTTSMARAA